jgi:hypothetical protein
MFTRQLHLRFRRQGLPTILILLVWSSVLSEVVACIDRIPNHPSFTTGDLHDRILSLDTEPTRKTPQEILYSTNTKTKNGRSRLVPLPTTTTKTALFVTSSRGGAASPVGKTTTSTTTIRRRHIRRGIDRLIDRVFDETDTNHDHTISFQEAYESVLKLYIQLNRQAPVPPPKRDIVLKLYNRADKCHNHRLNREEFQSLARMVTRRAVIRLVAHKAVTLLGAPLLAEWIVRSITGPDIAPRWEATIRWVCPPPFLDQVLPVVTSITFLRAVWVVLLVATLGNLCLNAVNVILELPFLVG